MKKTDFLAAVKGLTIRVEWRPGWTPVEKGAYEIVGIPESVKSVHTNQVLAWFREEFTPALEPHSSLESERRTYDRLTRIEDETGHVPAEQCESYEWIDAFERHPTEVFHC